MSYYEKEKWGEEVVTAVRSSDSGGDSTAGGRPSRRTGRRPGITGTRGDILRAARKLFAENGFKGATMRAIAAESNVDAALIHHFYQSKEGIFSAAIEDAFDPEVVVSDVLEVGDVHQRGERLVRVFLRTWESPESRDPLTAVLRSAMSHPDAARLLGDFVSTRVLASIVRATSPNQEDLRAALIGSQLIGLGMLRYVLKLEPLGSVDDEQIVTSVAPTVQRYLTGDIGPNLTVPTNHVAPANPPA